MDGVPVFYHHGWPACRLEASLFSEAAKQVGIRLIATDRPGFGRSDYLPGRRLLDWPEDLVQLASQLDLDRFRILGLSGGGPYTLACAHQLPQRVIKATVVAGLSPMNDPRTRQGMRRMNQFLLSIGPYAPWVLDLMMKLTRKMCADPEKLLKTIGDLPEVDQEVIRENASRFCEAIQESYRKGTKAATQEGKIYGSPWCFELSDIHIPVSIWQGTLDVNVPQSNSELIAELIPDANMNRIEGQGHLSLAVNKGVEILTDLIH